MARFLGGVCCWIAGRPLAVAAYRPNGPRARRPEFRCPNCDASPPEEISGSVSVASGKFEVLHGRRTVPRRGPCYCECRVPTATSSGRQDWLRWRVGGWKEVFRNDSRLLCSPPTMSTPQISQGAANLTRPRTSRHRALKRIGWSERRVRYQSARPGEFGAYLGNGRSGEATERDPEVRNLFLETRRH